MTLSEYERQREARIAANRERMQVLGVVELAQQHAESVREAQAARWQRRPTPAQPRAAKPSAPRAPEVVRRSGRISAAPPRSYAECDAELRTIEGALARGGKRGERRVQAQAAAPDERWREGPSFTHEEYTAADVAKLGSHKRKWTLFVDGYDSNGNRIYDKLHGQTCHQCRQKTACRHTACGQCQSLKGVFCGDCIMMRYGEHVDEIRENPDWAWRVECSPSCRDICNCSFCRVKKGYAPTGTLYRRAIAEGYASVAHYIIHSNLRTEPAEPAAAASVAPEPNPVEEAAAVHGGGGDDGGEPAAANESAAETAAPGTPMPPTPALRGEALASLDRSARHAPGTPLTAGPGARSDREERARRRSSLAPPSALRAQFDRCTAAAAAPEVNGDDNDKKGQNNKENVPPAGSPAAEPKRRSLRAKGAAAAAAPPRTGLWASLQRMWPTVRTSRRLAGERPKNAIEGPKAKRARRAQ